LMVAVPQGSSWVTLALAVEGDRGSLVLHVFSRVCVYVCTCESTCMCTCVCVCLCVCE
jgi:hypothetical protein